MNKFHILSLFCFILGFIFFSIGFLQGDVEGGVLIVFPLISGSSIYAFLGAISFFMAIIMFMYGFTDSLKSDEPDYDYEGRPPQKKTSIKGGGIVLIGPIPIVFGSTWKITLVMLIISIILVLVFYFAFRSFWF